MLFEGVAGARTEIGTERRVSCQLQNPVRQGPSIAWRHSEAALKFLNEARYFAIGSANEEGWSPGRSDAIEFAGHD